MESSISIRGSPRYNVLREYICPYTNLIFYCHWNFPLLDATTSMRALRALLSEYFLSQLSTQ